MNRAFYGYSALSALSVFVIAVFLGCSDPFPQTNKQLQVEAKELTGSQGLSPAGRLLPDEQGRRVDITDTAGIAGEVEEAQAILDEMALSLLYASEENKLNAVTELWNRAADLILSEEIDFETTFDSLETAADSEDLDVSLQASLALVDLYGLRDLRKSGGDVTLDKHVTDQIPVDDISQDKLKQRELKTRYSGNKQAPNTPTMEDLASAALEGDGEEQVEAVRRLWVRAADHVHTLDGEIDEVLVTLDILVRNGDENVVRIASQALEDLLKLKNAADQSEDHPHDEEGTTRYLVSDSGSELHTGNRLLEDSGYTSSERSPEAPLPVEMDSIYKMAYYPDKTVREIAIEKLSYYRYCDEAITLLLQMSRDPESSVRYLAVEKLWYLGADNEARRDEIISELENTTDDSDPGVSQLSRNALEDLSSLQ